MSYVTLEQAKLHLLVIHDADDVLIQQNIDAAEAYAANYMNRPDIGDNPVIPWKRNQGTVKDWLRPRCEQIYAEPVVSSESVDAVPKNVIQAILLATADFYENRTPTTSPAMSQSTNATFENLLWPNRVGMGI